MTTLVKKYWNTQQIPYEGLVNETSNAQNAVFLQNWTIVINLMFLKAKYYQTPLFTWKALKVWCIPYINVAKIDFTISKLRNPMIEHLTSKSRNANFKLCMQYIYMQKQRFECKNATCKEKMDSGLHKTTYLIYPVIAFHLSL